MHTYYNVSGYVSDNVPKKYAVSEKTFIEAITVMCCNLRSKYNLSTPWQPKESQKKRGRKRKQKSTSEDDTPPSKEVCCSFVTPTKNRRVQN